LVKALLDWYGHGAAHNTSWLVWESYGDRSRG